MALEKLIIKGARVNNLKNVNLEIPRDKLIVFTGLSGSGKSSLAFDTIYAEGQRRYVESLSSYARMFLGQMDKPDVDSIEGLSPAISIDQKTTSKNPRSTVGTVTEIYDYLRLLYARVGTPHCPVCKKEIKQQTTDQIVKKVLALKEGTKIQVLAPVVRGRKGRHEKELESAKKSGFVRARIDGNMYELSEEIVLDKNIKHHIEIVVDRLVIKDEIKSRLYDSVETAAKLANGIIIIDVIDGEELHFSQNYACEEHGLSIPELTPTLFSFNNPLGACPSCSGIGRFLKVNPDLIIENEEHSINEGVFICSGWNIGTKGDRARGSIARMYFEGLARHYGFSLDMPYYLLNDEQKSVLLYGTQGEKIDFIKLPEWGGGIYHSTFEGICNNLERRFRETESDYTKREIEGYMSESVCPSCKGARLKPEALCVTIGGKNIDEFCTLPITDELEFLDTLSFGEQNSKIAGPIIKEIKARLEFLNGVGLSYLNLARSSGTLSGGESQRIRLATQIGSGLTGVLYILDEPSIGLHQRDNGRLLEALKRLRDLGNTLVVVEHDEDTMKEADYIVDIGPGAGVHGGEIIYSGTLDGLLECKDSITAQYLSKEKEIPVPEIRRKGNGNFLSIYGAEENNLKKINVKIPLGTFTCVTGVSGSGKSSLVNDIVYKYLSNKLNKARSIYGKFKKIEGTENLDKVIDIDQSPIGRTPRSNPATYTGVFNDIRELFSLTKDAKMKGYGPGRFSFNVRGGRCEACEGDGIIKIEMQFLPDVYVPCEVCEGKRYNEETLLVKYKGKSIADVLDMTVEEGMHFFESIPKIHRKIKTLYEVGLGYIKLGQSATTLSGGEAQRVKLATELSKRSTGKTIYILDEPTTGLHTADVHRLLEVLLRLVEAGNTVLTIEHNLDVIKTADYIIDLGPEGGDGGGEIIAFGTPEEVAKNRKSFTGKYLKDIL